MSVLCIQFCIQYASTHYYHDIDHMLNNFKNREYRDIDFLHISLPGQEPVYGVGRREFNAN